MRKHGMPGSFYAFRPSTNADIRYEGSINRRDGLRKKKDGRHLKLHRIEIFHVHSCEYIYAYTCG